MTENVGVHKIQGFVAARSICGSHFVKNYFAGPSTEKLKFGGSFDLIGNFGLKNN